MNKADAVRIEILKQKAIGAQRAYQRLDRKAAKAPLGTFTLEEMEAAQEAWKNAYEAYSQAIGGAA